MPNYDLLLTLITVLGSAFLGGFISRKLKQPIIFGYLIAGLVVSGLTSTLGFDKKSVTLLAEIGLALLMFTLGLEFTLRKIDKFKIPVGFGATLQILLTIFLGTIVLHFLFKLGFNSSFIMSCAFSLSSTAIVVKILDEKARLESLPGEILTGWLLIQDLAILPLISILPIFFASSGFEQNLLSLLKAILVLGITWFGTRKAISKFVDLVASLKSRELLLILVVGLVFGLGLLTSKLGFSFGLGAFLAGLILSQASSHFAIFSEIRPLRDVFLAVFFVSLGLSLEPSFLITNFVKIFELGIFVIFLKFLIVFIILASFKYHARTIFECAFGLSQVGEFAFVLATISLSGKYLKLDDYSLIVSVALLTMVLTPWLFNLSDYLYKKISPHSTQLPKFLKHFFSQQDRSIDFQELPFENHAVILGYGRVGKWVGETFKSAKIPFVVVEYNPETVRHLRLLGETVIYGDPTDINVLDFAQVDKAKIVVLAIPDPLSQKMIITNCQALNPKIQIICRSHLEDNSELKSLGIKHIIHPEFEAALSISHRALQVFGFDREAISGQIKKVKIESKI